MTEPLLKLVLLGKESPSAFQRYKMLWEVNNEGKTLAEYLGVSESDLEDLNNNHSFRFVAFRTFYRKHLLERVFSGAYVQFVSECEYQQPRLEYGWVDFFNRENKTVDVHCDDNYQGNRALTINLRDIVQLLPTKERPNIFFKAMLCQECKDCSKDSGEFIEDCPFFGLFTAIKENRLGGREIIRRIVKNEKSTTAS